MKKIPLIHPIYLDVPMLVSFAAAMQGGLSLESEVTSETKSTDSLTAKGAGKFGFSKLFQALVDSSVSADLAGDANRESHKICRESKEYTEASIAIVLYHQLQQQGGYIINPKNTKDFHKYSPGNLIELAGTLEKNAVDAVIDYLEAAEILGKMAESPSQSQTSSKGKSFSTGKTNKQSQNDLIRMRDALDSDRKRTPISNVIMRCSEPDGLNAVVTLRTENLRDLTLSELHNNDVRVIGKITRKADENQSMKTFENYGLAMFESSFLENIFGQIANNASTGGIITKFADIQVNGPALQILPLMIFV